MILKLVAQWQVTEGCDLPYSRLFETNDGRYWSEEDQDFISVANIMPWMELVAMVDPPMEVEIK